MIVKCSAFVAVQVDKSHIETDVERLAIWLKGLSREFSGTREFIHTPHGIALLLNAVPIESDSQLIPGDACQYLVIQGNEPGSTAPEDLVTVNPACAGMTVNESGATVLFRGSSGAQAVYGAWDQECAVLCSNLAFLNNLGLELDKRSLAWYLRYFYIPAPFTVYARVSSVLPGEIKKILGHQQHEKHSMSKVTGADRVSARSIDGSVSSATASLDELFEERVRSCCTESLKDCKDQSGLLLSGGKDSSGLAVGVAIASQRVDCLTLGFPDDEHCERTDAESVVKALGLSGQVHDVSSDKAVGGWKAFCKAIGQPMGDPAALPLWCGLTSAFSGYEVLLDGTGNDSYFGLRPAFRSRSGWYLKRLLWKIGLDPIACSISRRVSSRTSPKFLANAEEFYISWRGFDRKALEKAFALNLSWHSLPIFNDYACQATPADHMTKTVCGLWEPEAAYRKLIQLTSLRGVSVRYPYLNPALRELVQAVPEEFRHHKGKNKILLRRLLQKYLPESVNRKPKGSFVFPVALVLENSETPYLKDFYRKSSWEDLGMTYLWSIIEPVLRRYLAGDSSVGGKVYSLFVLFSWLMQEREDSGSRSDVIPACLDSLGLSKAECSIPSDQTSVSAARS